mmetsp:Transcript_123271/g.343209  ORF Transcript_123271/g.343209 Transcript_123271/m.343209 type:complete len:205 (+) Transcript_123271:510-1124(+)
MELRTFGPQGSRCRPSTRLLHQRGQLGGHSLLRVGRELHSVAMLQGGGPHVLPEDHGLVRLQARVHPGPRSHRCGQPPLGMQADGHAHTWPCQRLGDSSKLGGYAVLCAARELPPHEVLQGQGLPVLLEAGGLGHVHAIVHTGPSPHRPEPRHLELHGAGRAYARHTQNGEPAAHRPMGEDQVQQGWGELHQYHVLCRKHNAVL